MNLKSIIDTEKNRKSNLYIRGWRYPQISSYNELADVIRRNFDIVLEWLSDFPYLDKIIVDTETRGIVKYTFIKENLGITKAYNIADMSLISDFGYIILSLDSMLHMLTKELESKNGN